MSDNPPPLSKADRIAIGGAVAPIVRQRAEGPSRSVTVVDKDGRPVRKTTAVEVTKAVLARSEIEFSVQEGKRPEWVACKTCGAPVKVGKSGRVREFCRPRTHKCQCGKPVVPKFGCGFGKSCARCTGANALRSMTLEERQNWAKVSASKGGRAATAKLSKEELRERLRRNREAMTHEQRSQHSKRSAASRTSEARSAAIREQWANMTPEQRAARCAKISAAAVARRKAKDAA